MKIRIKSAKTAPYITRNFQTTLGLSTLTADAEQNVDTINNNITAMHIMGGGIVAMPAGTFPICGSIIMKSKVTLIGAAMGLTTLFMPASCYTNTVDNQYDDTSVAINCSGHTGSPYTPKEDITLFGFTIESEVSDGRILYPIIGRNIEKFNILSVEVFGIPSGNLITLDSVVGGEITQCFLHDCTTADANSIQTTGIESDDNRINNVNCVNVEIHHNTITDIVMTGAALPTANMNTDGVNLGVGSSQGCTVHDNYIARVGEGIDLFSSECIVYANEIVDCNNVGVKLVHGASYNQIFGNTIIRPQLAGLYISSSADGASEHNYFHGNLIHDVASDDVWSSTSPSAMFVDFSVLHAFAANSNIFKNNAVTGGLAHMDYGIRVDGGTGNQFIDNDVQIFATAYSIDAGTSTIIINARKEFAQIGLAATEATAAGVEEIVPFETTVFDTRGEFNVSTHIYTAASPRRLSVKASVRCYASTAEDWFLRIKKNGIIIAESQSQLNTTQQFTVQSLAEVTIGDTIGVYVYQNNGGRNIGGDRVASYLMIEEVAS